MKFSKGIVIAVPIFLACALFAEGMPWTGNATLTGRLLVESNVANAEVYCDSVLAGVAPLTKDGLSPGLHQVVVMKEGYARELRTIRIIAGEETSIRIELRPINGTLVIAGIPDGAAFEVIADGKSYKEQSVEVAEGTFPVTVKVFGYKNHEETISIKRDETVTITAATKKETFTVTDLAPSKTVFNPANPAKLGTVRFSFLVTAPGKGELEIRDAEGNAVRTIRTELFKTWKQAIVWDGKNDAGENLPDGAYRATLNAASEDESESAADNAAVKIDRSIAFPLTGSGEGIGSMGPVVTAALMPPKGMLFSFDGYGQSREFGSGAALQIGFTDWLEGGARMSAGIGSSSDTAIDFAGGIKAGKKIGNVNEALALVWKNRSGTIPDSSSPYRDGITLGPAIEYRLGAVNVGAFPSLTVGNENGMLTGAWCTASGGATIRFALGVFSGGLWGNADSGKIGGAFKPLAGWGTGAALQFTIPATNLFLSADAAWNKKEDEDGSLYIKGGFGIRF